MDPTAFCVSELDAEDLPNLVEMVANGEDTPKGTCSLAPAEQIHSGSLLSCSLLLEQPLSFASHSADRGGLMRTISF